MPSPKTPKFLKLAPPLEAAMLLHDPRGKQWVRVPLALLDDPKFDALDEVSQAHLLKLIMLVRRIGFNHLPNDEQFLRRKIGAQSKINLELLRSEGFLTPAKRLRTKSSSATVSVAANRHDTTQDDLTRDNLNAHNTTDGAARGARVRGEVTFEDCLDYVLEQRRNGTQVGGRPIENAGGLAQDLFGKPHGRAQVLRWKETQVAAAMPAPPTPEEQAEFEAWNRKFGAPPDEASARDFSRK